jgi:putative heme iron utilization protein
MGKRERLKQLADLLRETRWAALATVGGDGAPQASMVAYAGNGALTEFYFHLSRMAAHTGNLVANPHCSLAVSEQDRGSGDPQLLARASLQGSVEILTRESEAYHEAKAIYLAKLPDSEQLFEFPDFLLFRFIPNEIRFVGGFGQAFTFDAGQLMASPQAE